MVEESIVAKLRRVRQLEASGVELDDSDLAEEGLFLGTENGAASVLNDSLGNLNLTPEQAEKILGLEAGELVAVIEHHAPITARIAIRLEAVGCEFTAQQWLEMQAEDDLSKAFNLAEFEAVRARGMAHPETKRNIAIFETMQAELRKMTRNQEVAFSGVLRENIEIHVTPEAEKIASKLPKRGQLTWSALADNISGFDPDGYYTGAINARQLCDEVGCGKKAYTIPKSYLTMNFAGQLTEEELLEIGSPWGSEINTTKH